MFVEFLATPLPRHTSEAATYELLRFTWALSIPFSPKILLQLYYVVTKPQDVKRQIATNIYISLCVFRGF